MTPLFSFPILWPLVASRFRPHDAALGIRIGGALERVG